MSETILTIIIVAVFLLLLVVRKPLVSFFRGKKGELSVKLRLQMLPSENYKIINDLLISINGHTSQIDHVVVSEYGIFVVETKNYKGWIYGGADSEYWTQNIYGNKYKLYNPIRQNQSHIRMLSRLLPEIHPRLFVSIVAFSRQATLKNQHLGNVIYWNRINRLIRSYSQKQISSEQAENVYSTLLEVNSNSRCSRKQHVQNVRGEVYRRHDSVINGFCPRCGGSLVLRQGEYGKFYGCSNYPRCRFTHNI